MIPTASFDQIDGLLNNEQVQLQSGIAEGFPLKTRTVGFLVFDQNYVRGPIRDLVGNLDMLNVHSGTYMHFFLCGVSRYGANEGGAKDLGEVGGVPLYHNAQARYSFIEAFECGIPGWHHQMGFDLVLVDVKEDGAQRVLDFSKAIYFRVDELIKQNVVERPSDLLGKLIKFAREGRLTGARQVSRRNSRCCSERTG